MPYNDLMLEQDDYIASLIAEYENLQKKISDLENLIAMEYMSCEEDRGTDCAPSTLTKQLSIMNDYANILGCRIGAYWLKHKIEV